MPISTSLLPMLSETPSLSRKLAGPFCSKNTANDFSEKLTKPYLAFSLPDSFVGVDKMQIQYVLVYRISKYLSVDEKSVLKVSEVIDLDITQTPVPDKSL